MLGMMPAFLVLSNYFLEPKISMDKGSLANSSLVIIQGNLPINVVRSDQDLWPYAKQTYFDNIAHLHFKPDTLLVLPEEGIIPGWVNVEYPEGNLYFRMLSELAAKKKIHIMTGVLAYKTLPADGRATYNAIALIEPSGKPAQFYFKRDLVPFGETVPFFDLHWLTAQLKKVGVDFDPSFQAGGEQPAMTMTAADGQYASVGALSCFELIKPELARHYRQAGTGPMLLVNTSNLGWFHGHEWLAHRRLERLMQQQFLAIGQMRAAENRSFLIIAANTGISAIISPGGDVLARSDRDGQPLPGGATLLMLGDQPKK